MARGWRIVVEEGDRAGDAVPIEGQVVLGRDPSCGLALEDTGASRRHAILASSPAGPILLDLESRNGTFVNGERVRRASLRAGDRIRIGRTVLLVEEAEGREDRAEPAAQAEPSERGGVISIRGGAPLAWSPHHDRPGHTFFSADLSQAGPLRRIAAAGILLAAAALLAWGAYRVVVDMPFRR